VVTHELLLDLFAMPLCGNGEHPATFSPVSVNGEYFPFPISYNTRFLSLAKTSCPELLWIGLLQTAVLLNPSFTFTFFISSPGLNPFKNQFPLSPFAPSD